VRQKVDVIVTYGGAVTVLKQSTPVIPIVFAVAIDPIGGGLVADLSRPGGNVTGLSLQATEMAGKRLDLLREALLHLRRLAIISDAGYPAARQEMGEVQRAAGTLGLEVTPHEIRRAEDIAPVFEALKSQADALYVVDDALFFTNSTQISTLALGARLPTIFAARRYVKAGQTTRLCSYAPPSMSIRFYAGQNLVSYRSNSPPNSISSSISRPPRPSASPCRITYWCSPMR
jgi:putative tryptophan/tyrosine transport system substrate-binding protein